MIDLILWSLVLLLVQLVTPSVLALMGGQVSVAYLLSARDETAQTSGSVLRAQRAAANLLETLPAFLVLAVLSLLNDTDVIVLAQAWLVLRVIYLGLYLAGTAYVRSVVWVGALGCLVGMALPLL
ncbi:MAG: MAPEG family protein [Proteobacteria bacterium]|nr:MAPEG family protein [Pseudomonadota bacterium]